MIDREKKDGREMRLSRAAEAKTEREKRRMRITEITGIPIACHEASQRHDQTRLRKKSSLKSQDGRNKNVDISCATRREKKLQP